MQGILFKLAITLLILIHLPIFVHLATTHHQTRPTITKPPSQFCAALFYDAAQATAARKQIFSRKLCAS
jgi:hypothetical protein